MFLIFFQFSLILLWQFASPLTSPVPNAIKETISDIGSIATPIAAIGLIVAIVYFFWHSKNREELTKALAEAISLCDTRGKKIGDLEKTIAEKDLIIAALDAKILVKAAKIVALEEEDEKRAKTEFRLRAEIAELEKASVKRK